jgi:hypothetical protein
MDTLQYSIWQKPYQSAVAEINPQKLSGRIAAAETAIALRMKQASENCVGQEEQSAMQCARQVLKTLKFWRSIPDSWRPHDTCFKVSENENQRIANKEKAFVGTI